MSVVVTFKAKNTLRFWRASLAWKNIDDWAAGWTQESFIQELRFICNDNGKVGFAADSLLGDMVHDKERTPKDIPGEIVSLHSKTKIVGLDSLTEVHRYLQGFYCDDVLAHTAL